MHKKFFEAHVVSAVATVATLSLPHYAHA